MPTATALPPVSAPSVIVVAPTGTAVATATTSRAPAGRPAPTETPAARAAATPAAAATVAADLATGPHTVYVVRAGDTLYGIARRYGLSANVLADFNHLAPPYKIIEGHRLLIPAV